MIRHPLERHPTRDKRRRWVELLLATADELAMRDEHASGDRPHSRHPFQGE